MDMDLDPNASLDNLPTMTVTEGIAVIDVQKTDSKNDNAADSDKDNSIAIILIKEKKQTPPATEE